MSAVAIFVRVVDEKGFTPAAKSLGLSTSYVSRQISALENRLGVRLLNRSTRRQSLTPVGALFYRNCTNILAQLEEAELAVTQLQTVPRGLLRVAAPSAFGRTQLSPLMARFMAHFSDLEVEVDLENRTVDPAEEGYDVVLRVGEKASGELLARKIASSDRLLVATPAYLDARGRPQIPDELSDHAALLGAAEAHAGSWRLYHESQATATVVSVRPVLTSNTEEVLLAGCLDHRGIAYLPDFVVSAQLASGALERVLPIWGEETAGIFAVYHERKHLSAKVRLFIDFLDKQIGEPAPWSVRPKEQPALTE